MKYTGDIGSTVADKEEPEIFTIDATDMTLKEIREAFKEHEEEEKQNEQIKSIRV